MSEREKPDTWDDNVRGLFVKEAPELMIFRRRFFHEYNGAAATITAESMNLKEVERGLETMSKTELTQLYLEIYEGGVRMNDQISYLERLARVQMAKHQRYKTESSIAFVIIAFVALLVWNIVG